MESIAKDKGIPNQFFVYYISNLKIDVSFWLISLEIAVSR